MAALCLSQWRVIKVSLARLGCTLDGDAKLGSVNRVEFRIDPRLGNAIQRIHTCAMKTFRYRNRMNRRAIKETYGVFYYFIEICRSIDMLRAVEIVHRREFRPINFRSLGVKLNINLPDQ